MAVIIKETLETLVDKFNQYEIAEKLNSTPSTICKLIKKYDIYYKKKSSKGGYNNRKGDYEDFEKSIRKRYAGATVFLKRILVMWKGKLENTEVAIRWWNEKIEKAWERRHNYEGIL